MGGALDERLVLEVVDVGAANGQELRVLLAKNAIAENASAHAGPPDELDVIDARPYSEAPATSTVRES
jgi:hypothetical protein